MKTKLSFQDYKDIIIESFYDTMSNYILIFMTSTVLEIMIILGFRFIQSELFFQSRESMGVGLMFLFSMIGVFIISLVLIIIFTTIDSIISIKSTKQYYKSIK